MTMSGTVWSAVPEMSSSGPRSLLSVLTLAWKCITKLAAAAGTAVMPAIGWPTSRSVSDSSCDRAFPKPNRRNPSRVAQRPCGGLLGFQAGSRRGAEPTG